MPTVTPYSQQDIHIYTWGDDIPGYVSNTYQPVIWYDQSKSTVGGTTDVFAELGIAESLVLGETYDDLWDFETILDEICKYFNLHCIVLGYDFYLFDIETAKSGNSVTWLNLMDPTKTKQSTYDTVLVQKAEYCDDSTQISMGDVYNQVIVTDKVTKFEDVILSPFDDENLTDMVAHQKYMVEYAATGEGNKAKQAFINLINGGIGEADYNGSDSSTKREWWFNTKSSKYWRFKLNGVDNYDQIPVDASGNRYKQWLLSQYVDSTPWASGVFSFGSGEKTNNKNISNVQNITSFTDYIVINVQGNGYDENSPATETVYNEYGIPTGTVATHIYPNEHDIQNSKMRIEYVNANDGVYSSADSSVTNYLVFSGKMKLTTAHERSGSQGFSGYPGDAYNYWTAQTNSGNREFHYVDEKVFLRKNNTFYDIKNRINSGLDISGRCVPSSDNDDGRYFTELFYTQNYPTDADAPNENIILLAPPCAEGDLSRRFKYSIDGNHSYYGNGANWDSIPYIDVLACTLQIGDKYCVESVVNNKKHFEWMTEDELKAANKYLILDNGNTIYDAFIYLGINVDDGDFLINQEHDIFNNISTNMGLDKTGMAIPLPSNEHLSGELRFAIIGVVNLVWGQGIRRHPTWFRHTTWTESTISVMPHVDKIYISKFDVSLVSDNGKIVTNDDADIVYMSDETKKYIKRKDDIEFKFNTALTASEAQAMGTTTVLAKSTVVNVATGDAILNIVNNVTSETDKPERFYVDCAWREYNTPRMILESNIHDYNDMEHLDAVQLRKFTFPYLEGKQFFVLKTERDLKNESIALTLKEKNS